MSIFKKKKPSEEPKYKDPFPNEDEKAFSKSAMVPDDSQITSPGELADELLAGTVILGCGAQSGNLVYINDVYVIRDNILFEIGRASCRERV